MFFDRVTCEATADRAQQRHRGASAAAAELVADHAARNRAADRADTGAVAFLTRFRNRDDRTAARAHRGAGRLLRRCILLRLRRRLRLLRNLRLRGWLRGDRYRRGLRLLLSLLRSLS